jgi:hypothetical protein
MAAGTKETSMSTGESTLRRGALAALALGSPVEHDVGLSRVELRLCPGDRDPCEALKARP